MITWILYIDLDQTYQKQRCRNRMKYLLLSIIVVCTIGILVPNVSGEHFQFESGVYLHPNEQKVLHTILEIDEMLGEIPKTDVGQTMGFQDYISISKLNIYEGKNSDLIVIRLVELNPNVREIDAVEFAQLMDEQNRIFENVASYSTAFVTTTIDFIPKGNTNLDFNAICSGMNAYKKIQPSLTFEHNVCFEIPKNSDHFILTSSGLGGNISGEEWLEEKFGIHDDWRHQYTYACNAGFPKYIAEVADEHPFGCLPAEKDIIALFDRDDVGTYNVFAQEQELTTEPEVKSQPAQQASTGCGEGTVMINGVCQLAKSARSTSMNIEPLYIIIGVVAIGGVIGAIAVAKRGSKTQKPAKQDLDEYEEQYLAKQKPSRKPAKKKETSTFCDNCGKSLRPTAKFCGSCGTSVP